MRDGGTQSDVYNTRSGYDPQSVRNLAVGGRPTGPPIPPEPGTGSAADTIHPSPVNRILWNERGRCIDEIVISDATVHVEQMGDRCWWIGITRSDGGYWAGNFTCDSRGRMRFVEQDRPDGFDWDRDDTHEVEL